MGELELELEERDRVLIVEDHEDTRNILTDYLAHYGYEPCPAANGTGALVLAAGFSPALALLDIGLPDMPGTHLAARLKELCPEVGIIFMTGYDSIEQAVKLVRAGAFSYLAKPLSLNKVLETLNEARAMRAAARTPAPLELSKREREIVALLAEGKNNQQIAKQLNLTEQSVKNRLRGIYPKLGVSTRAQAIVRVIELKLTKKG